MDDQSERERGLFRDWAVRKPWAPGAKNADKTLAPADETDGAHDPVLEAFNALAATDHPNAVFDPRIPVRGVRRATA